MSHSQASQPRPPPLEPVAGNGLLDRRALLGRGIVFAGAMTTGAGTALTSAAAEPLKDDPWSLEMGAVVPAYQVPSRFEKDVIRTRSNPNNEFRNSHARTPHHLLQGTVTPNGLFFSISHSGLPDIDPAQHKLVIHGLVKQPLVYTVESLSRYPMVTRMAFRRVQRQQRADVLQRARAGHRPGAARARLQRRMDRRAAVDAAGGDRHRPEGEMAARGRRRLDWRCIAACR